jgi:hypothetical protein
MNWWMLKSVTRGPATVTENKLQKMAKMSIPFPAHVPSEAALSEFRKFINPILLVVTMPLA